jgi:hypothetical protein
MQSACILASCRADRVIPDSRPRSLLPIVRTRRWTPRRAIVLAVPPAPAPYRERFSPLTHCGRQRVRVNAAAWQATAQVFRP